ncbi:MAG: sugar transferase [Lachnospiraceae bacterium]|nr:sugar transferase [Lachnospiraceae bacterium]
MLVSVKMLFHTNLNNALMAKNKPRTALVGDESTFEKFFYFLNKTSIVIDFVGYIAWSKNDYDAAATGADKNGDNEVTVDNTDADNSNVAGTDAVINAYGTGVSNMSADKNGDNKTESDKTGVGGVTENDTEKPGTGKTKYIGYMEKLEEVLHEHRIDQLYIMQRDTDQPDSFQPVIDMCMDLGVTVRMVVDIYKKRNASSYVSSVGTYPIITYHTITLNTHEQVIKRIFDIAASIFGIIVFSPIMLATAIAIKLDSKGPVLFKQTRVGKNGRLFKIYKFRSMFVDAEERKAELMKQNQMQNGPMFKMKDDPRITKVGKFIRKTSIDELPQFFNILGGSMSLVGTRPPTVDEVEKYERNQWRRISIKPGLTGMWQVSGRSAITDFNKVVELDTEYIDKWSLGLDFIIILKTVRVLLLRKGAF